MQSLSEKKHKALITALQQLAEWSDMGSPLSLPTGQAGSEVCLGEEIRRLDDLLVKYNGLLSELGDCIENYQELYKDLRTNVLGPQLRQIRHKMDQRSLGYHILKKHLVAVRSY